MDGDVYEELGTNFVQAPCRKHRVMQCPEGGAVWCRCKSTHAAEVLAVQILGTALGLVQCWKLFPVCILLGPSELQVGVDDASCTQETTHAG